MRKTISTIATLVLILTLLTKVGYVNAQTPPADPCQACLDCGDVPSCYSGTYGLSYTSAAECFCDPAGCNQSCVPVNTKSWMLIPLGLGLVVVGWLFNKKKS